MTCARCGEDTGGRRKYCGPICRRQRPKCARRVCTNRVKRAGRRFCSRSCAAYLRPIAVRRQAGRASWLKVGQVRYQQRLDALDQRPEVQAAPSKAAAYAAGVQHGLKLTAAVVRRFYQRTGLGDVPPGLTTELRRTLRRRHQRLDQGAGVEPHV